MTVEQAEELSDEQRPAFIAWIKLHCLELVESIQERHASANLREIERVCGVPGEFLARVLAGTEEPSMTLVRLLEAYSLVPAEYLRQRDAGPWAWPNHDTLAKGE